MRGFKYFIPVICWFLFTTFLLVIPGNDLPKNPFLTLIYFDKWVHIGLFSILNFLFIWGFMRRGMLTVKTFIYCSLICILYGTSMEFVQKYFAFERSFDVTDILADTGGVLLGYLMVVYVIRKKNKPL
ncbi:MAG: VanZ family protein [Bacteroidota bacterium]